MLDGEADDGEYSIEYNLQMNRAVAELFRAVAQAKSLEEVRGRVMDGAGEVFGARAWGFYLLDKRRRPEVIDVRGEPDAFVDRYEEMGRSVDPVMGHVVRHHAAAHDAMVMPDPLWLRSDLYLQVSGPFGLRHIMTGPIVGGGRLIGTLNLGRGPASPPFSMSELSDFWALCTHVSASVASFRSPGAWTDAAAALALTPRQLRIADLVADGRTNADIAAELWITEDGVKQALKRMYAKLGVSGRAALVARLRESLRQG